MRSFFVAWQFLTVFPIPCEMTQLNSQEDFKKALQWFPWVGLILGVFCSIIHFVLSLFLPIPLVSTLVVVSLTLMSGGLHLDGLADTADAMMSAKSSEQMLEIMKDSRSGPMGIFAVASVIFIKVIAITHIHEEILSYTLILSPVLGRSSVVFMMNCLPYARKGGGLASLFLNFSYSKRGGSLFQWPLIFNGLAVALLCFILLDFFGFFGLIFCLLASEYIIKICQKKIHGFTGDTLGASCEIIEALFWVFAASKRIGL